MQTAPTPTDLSEALGHTTSLWPVVDRVFAAITATGITTEVETFSGGTSVVVSVFRAYAPERTAWAHLATVVLTEGYPVEIYDVAPRPYTRISAAELARRTQGAPR